MNVETKRRVADLKRRLANARKRAAYASGNPNWGNRGYRGLSGHGDDLYELALCDIKSLAGILESLTGKSYKLSDPKRVFRAGMSKLMSTALASKPNAR